MIPIRIEPFFWILAFLIGWLNSQSFLGSVLWCVVIVISVLVHEFGHALTAVFFKQKARITLTAFGGLTERDGPKLRPWQDFFVIFNGPLAGFCLYLACVAVIDSGLLKNAPISLYMVTAGSYANLFWTIVNLAPVHPLDGGQLLLVVLKGIFGIRGIRLTFLLSCLISIAIGIGFFLLHALLAGAIFLIFAFESYRNFASSRFITAADDSEGIKTELELAIKDFDEGRYQDAEEKFISLMQKTKVGLTHLTSASYLARILKMKGENLGAYELLEPCKDSLDVYELQLLQKLAFELKKYQEAIELGEKVHPELADADVALMNAISHAQLHQTMPAIGWLQTAIRDGLSDPVAAIKHPGFDPIRHTKEFIDYSTSIET